MPNLYQQACRILISIARRLAGRDDRYESLQPIRVPVRTRRTSRR